MKYKFRNFLKQHNFLLLSIICHIIIFIPFYLNFSFNKKIQIQEKIVTVDILPITKLTNLKQKTSLPNKTKSKLIPKKEQQDKKTLTKTNKQNQQPAKLDYEKLLDKLNKKKQNDSAPQKKDSNKEKNVGNKTYDNTRPLSISEQDAIREQITKNWNYPAGVADINKLQVLVKIELERDGTITNIIILEKPKSKNQNLNEFAINSVIRAIKLSSPLKLPIEKYEQWKEYEINFNPIDMINGA